MNNGAKRSQPGVGAAGRARAAALGAGVAVAVREFFFNGWL